MFGIKLFHLSTFNAVLIDFILYYGNKTPQLIAMKEEGLITEMILANYLGENGKNVAGTIRQKRKEFPLELKNTILQKREAAFYLHESMVIVKYRTNGDSARG